MVQYEVIDRDFAALADPTRRGILQRLASGRATIGELAHPVGMTITGMRKHVGVLEQAHLVTTRKEGRARVCELGPRTLDDAAGWIDAWQRQMGERLDRLEELVDRRRGARP